MPGAKPKPLDPTLLAPRECDWAYLAGIVDGEGHYSAHSSTNNSPCIVVAMAEPEVVEWCLRVFGGKLDSKLWNGRSTFIWRWRLGGLRNVEFATRKLAPYLRLKCDENAAMLAWAVRSLDRPSYDVPTSRCGPSERAVRGAAWAEWKTDCQRLRDAVRETRTARKQNTRERNAA